VNLVSGIRPGRGRAYSALPVLLGIWAAVLGWPPTIQGQEELTLPELEGLYRGAEAGYEEAFEVLEVLESQFDRASQDLTDALDAGDEEAVNQAYAETQRLGPLRRQAERRVEEKATELREVRRRLQNATADYLEELVQALESPPDDPEERRGLVAILTDTRNRLTELRDLEDPPLTLEAEPDINKEPTDNPSDLRAKANILEIRAGAYEDQLAFNQTQLEALRREQQLLRRSGDFLADFTRFDDPTVPVGPPTSRTVPPPGQVQPQGADSTQVGEPPLTLEQRIRALEVLQEEIAQRIQNIRIKAAGLRRDAGGEWA
jgi:hypothetical protein